MRKILYVSPHGTQWNIHWEGESSGIIQERKEDAIAIARKMVAELGAGTVSEIRVQRSDGTLQTEWTYGRDPYPPKG